jgi:hypothetical protein
VKALIRPDLDEIGVGLPWFVRLDFGVRCNRWMRARPQQRRRDVAFLVNRATVFISLGLFKIYGLVADITDVLGSSCHHAHPAGTHERPLRVIMKRPHSPKQAFSAINLHFGSAASVMIRGRNFLRQQCPLQGYDLSRDFVA